MACRGDLRVNVIRPAKRSERQPTDVDHLHGDRRGRTDVRDRYGTCVQCNQKVGSGPEDVRRRGAAATTGAAAASAKGHAEGSAAADDAAAAGSHERGAATDSGA